MNVWLEMWLLRGGRGGITSSVLKPAVLKEGVQVYSKELRGVPGTGVCNYCLGPSALESQSCLVAIQACGPHPHVLVRHWSWDLALHSY